MKINGLMIDCSRLLEQKRYYFRLLEFMAQWEMNTLMLHFSDDHGFALKLEGFEELSMRNAWTQDKLVAFLDLAASLDIEIIPELETFGHTRYITDKPEYQHLYAGKRTQTLRFNAINPLLDETHQLMSRLIQGIANQFPSEYLHLGCDEVDLTNLCSKQELQVDEVWSDYVNRMIHLTRRAGKIPMLWADHVVSSDAIARKLRKDVILVEWRYDDPISTDTLPRLRSFGFGEIILAPSLACFSSRFLPTQGRLENTMRMFALGKKHNTTGLINTIWCPWRYLQNAMYYGIAYSAHTVNQGAPPDMTIFHQEFVRKTFHTELTPSLTIFLENWTKLAIDYPLATKVIQTNPDINDCEYQQLQIIDQLGRDVLRAAQGYIPRTNQDIWHGMVLAAQCAWLCAENLVLRLEPNPPPERLETYNKLFSKVKGEMSLEWDQTRYPDDPQKTTPLFESEAEQHAMIMIKNLPPIT